MKNRLSFQIIVFAAIRTVVNTMHRMVYPFLPVFARGLGIEIEALSLAITGRSVVGTFGPFLAALADSRGRKLGMLAGLGLFTLGVSLVVFWPTFPTFVAALILSTLGKYIFDPPMQAYLGDRVPYARRGLALAVTELGWSLAFVGGVPLMGYLIASRGWMSPFGTLTVLGLLSVLLIAWMLPRDPAADPDGPGTLANIKKVFGSRMALAGLLVGVLASAANEVINLVFGVWLEDAFGLQIAALGVTAAVIGLAELGGETLVGGLVDRLGKPRAIAIGLVANSLAALALPLLGQSVFGAMLGLFLFYISFEFTLVSIIPLMTEVLPAARATMMAFNVAGLSLGRALGASMASPLYHLGVPASAIAALVFNLLALWTLSRMRTQD